MAALFGKPKDRVPVFPLLMHFAADRAGISYKEYATNGSALASAQMLVQDRFRLDAITACSDAFRISADMGGDIVYPEQYPPFLERPLIENERDLGKIGFPDPLTAGSRMADRVRGVTVMAKSVLGCVAVLGWVDMPFAEACSICGVTQFMMLVLDNPALAHGILDHLTRTVADFALAQIEAGADMIGAGDAAASLISSDAYREFALPYEEQVIDAIHSAGSLVKLHICGDTRKLLTSMIEAGADLYNVDHLVPFETARDTYSAHDKCFKGNLDPVADIMQASPEQCATNARLRIEQAAGKKYMLSAGCEIPAGTSDESFKAFCDAVTAGPDSNS